MRTNQDRRIPYDKDIAMLFNSQRGQNEVARLLYYEALMDQGDGAQLSSVGDNEKRLLEVFRSLRCLAKMVAESWGDLTIPLLALLGKMMSTVFHKLLTYQLQIHSRYCEASSKLTQGLPPYICWPIRSIPHPLPLRRE